MNRAFLPFALVFSLVLLAVNDVGYAIQKDQSDIVNIDKLLLKDSLITCVNQEVTRAINEYYQNVGAKEKRSYDLFAIDILELKRDKFQFQFLLKIKVRTFVGAHNPPERVEIITLQIKPGEVKTIDYKHQDES